jgi:hypothetical protein
MDIDVLEGLDTEPEIDFDANDWNQKVYDPESDRGNYVEFKNVSVPSRHLKRYVSRIGCYIHQPGLSRDVTFHVITKGEEEDGTLKFTEVGKELIRRFSNQWKAFLQGREAVTKGEPLEHCGFLNAAQVDNLKHLKLFTVEDLAALPDSAIPSLGHGGMTLKLRAQAHLDKSKGSTMLDKLIGEKEDLRNEVARLRTEMEELSKIARGSIPENPPEEAPEPVDAAPQDEDAAWVEDDDLGLDRDERGRFKSKS